MNVNGLELIYNESDDLTVEDSEYLVQGLDLYRIQELTYPISDNERYVLYANKERGADDAYVDIAMVGTLSAAVNIIKARERIA